MAFLVYNGLQLRTKHKTSKMNIFITDKCPIKSATNQNNKHVVKMPTETCQILCTNKRIVEGKLKTVYIKRVKSVIIKDDNNKKLFTIKTVKLIKRQVHTVISDKIVSRFGLSVLVDYKLYLATHINHPSTKWARENISNYQWTFEHFKALCEEYTFRYGKTHACSSLLDLLQIPPLGIPNAPLSRAELAMPDHYKHPIDTVAYRLYYHHEKRSFKTGEAKWSKRIMPLFMTVI